MPYIGGVYQLPPGTAGAPNTTIESAPYNTFISDIAAAQNTARPVVGGGTGGQTAVAGNDGLNTQGANIASGSTTNLGTVTGVYVNVTGTTTITSFGTVAAGAERILTFTGILTLTYNATSMILPGAADITTAVGDVATFRSLGAGNWKCVGYTRANGQMTASSFTSPQTINPGNLTITTSVGQAIGVSGAPAAGSPGVFVHAPSGAGNAAFVTLDRPGAFAANFGIDTDNKWKVGGYSMGANAYEILHMNNYTTLLDPRYFQTANFASTIASMALGAIGTYALLVAPFAGNMGPGTALAGSSLRYANAFGDDTGLVPSGTWRLMGISLGPSGSTAQRTSLWLRIS